MSRYYLEPINVELSEAVIVHILMKLNPKDEADRLLGEELAKHTSREWQDVFSHPNDEGQLGDPRDDDGDDWEAALEEEQEGFGSVPGYSS